MKKNKIIIGIIFICFLQALVSCSPIQSVTYIYRSSSSDKPFPAIKISTNKGANDTYTHISILEVHHTVDKNTFHRILQYSIKFSYSDTIPQKGYSPWYSYGLLLSSDKITERCVLDKNFRYVTYCDCYNGGYKVSRSGTEVVGDKKTQRYMVGRTAAEGYMFFVNLLPIIEGHKDLYNNIKNLAIWLKPMDIINDASAEKEK